MGTTNKQTNKQPGESRASLLMEKCEKRRHFCNEITKEVEVGLIVDNHLKNWK